MPNKVLIVSFDGLRPDLIDAHLTPNLWRLMGHGVTLTRQRTIYPSETRSAFPSFVTGATVDRHGMVGNRYVLREAGRADRLIDSSRAAILLELDRESDGRLMTAPTLGEILRQHGRSFAVLATNTAGTTTLFNHKAQSLGSIRISGHFREACAPEAVIADIEKALGPLPPDVASDVPDVEGQTYITTAFLEKIWPEFQPDVTVVSYGEPDRTAHFHGTASDTTREIIAHCDTEFGRLLDWWENEGRARGVHIIATSDHGHITGHTRVSVSKALELAGLKVGSDVLLMPGHVGALYVPGRERRIVDKIVATLREVPWCGSIFTRPPAPGESLVPGTLSTDLVMITHERGPDVAFAFRTDDRIDPYGLTGGTYYDADRRTGLGFHGGLHPKELAAVGILAGPVFRSGRAQSAVPSGICDLVPTALAILGLAPPPSMTGRVLGEAMLDAPISPVVTTETLEAGHGNYRQTLTRSFVAGVTYIDGAEASSP